MGDKTGARCLHLPLPRTGSPRLERARRDRASGARKGGKARHRSATLSGGAARQSSLGGCSLPKETARVGEDRVVTVVLKGPSLRQKHPGTEVDFIGGSEQEQTPGLSRCLTRAMAVRRHPAMRKAERGNAASPRGGVEQPSRRQHHGWLFVCVVPYQRRVRVYCNMAIVRGQSARACIGTRNRLNGPTGSRVVTPI